MKPVKSFFCVCVHESAFYQEAPQLVPRLAEKPALRPAPIPEALTVVLHDERLVTLPVPQQQRVLSFILLVRQTSK